MLKSLAMVVLGLLLGIVGSDVDSGVKRFCFGVFELADGIGFVIIAVGVFAVGEIISNLSEPEDRVVFHLQGGEPLPDAAGHETVHRSDHPGNGARGVLRGTARDRTIDRFVRLLHDREEDCQGPVAFGRGAIEGSRDPRPPTTRTRNASSFPCSRWEFPRAGRWR